jgi:hypothetical protein
MNLPTPITLTTKWRFVPTLRLFAGDTLLPVCQGFLLYKQDGFEFAAAFQIEHFVVVCERKHGGTWFLCLFGGDQHYTIAPVPSSVDMHELVLGFVLHRMRLLGINDFVFRPLGQGTVLQQLSAALADGYKG